MFHYILQVPAFLSMNSFGFIGASCAALVLIASSIACLAIYNLKIHPLASFPGPKLAGVSRLWYFRSLLTGRLPYDLERLHNQYGDVVRIAPNELSYTSSGAWKDIYGHRNGLPEMTKDPAFYASGSGSIVTAPRDQHSHLRRLMSFGFSDKALREQEKIMRDYADRFLKGIRNSGRDGQQEIDLVQWYNFFTFDLIGDLALGESFGCLDSSSYHPWVTLIFDTLKVSTFTRVARYYGKWAEWFLTPILVPGDSVSRAIKHREFTLERGRRRKALQTDRRDFLNLLTKPENNISEQSFTSNASALILAGSETTATLLSGATFHLLNNPAPLAKLTQEVRSTFATEDEISVVGVGKLPYLAACLDEALRMYPPVPGGFPRKVPVGGATICGETVPEKTVVAVTQWAANHSPRNFALPNKFIPERFLGDPRFAKDDKAALQPFHVGPRNCLGRNLAYVEMRLILARLVWNFDLELSPGCGNWDKQEIYTFWQKTPLLVTAKPVKRQEKV